MGLPIAGVAISSRFPPAKLLLDYGTKRGPLRRAHATARVHHTSWRRGRMATRVARAAAGDAGGRVF